PGELRGPRVPLDESPRERRVFQLVRSARGRRDQPQAPLSRGVRHLVCLHHPTPPCIARDINRAPAGHAAARKIMFCSKFPRGILVVVRRPASGGLGWAPLAAAGLLLLVSAPPARAASTPEGASSGSDAPGTKKKATRKPSSKKGAPKSKDPASDV